MRNSLEFNNTQIDSNSHFTSLNNDRFHRLRHLAFWSCIISFIFDIILGFTAFIHCMRTKSFVGFSYSVHALMDSLCTSFVAWHFNAKSIDDVNRRDRLACCVIGALFIGSFLLIETRAIQGIFSPPNLRPDRTVFIYSLIHIIAFTILTIAKIRISKQIKSTALKFDALNSTIGIIMVLPLMVWDRVVFINKLTRLDDLVKAFMALFLFVAGGKLILDSITLMNAEYARKLREQKVKNMLKETDYNDCERLNGSNFVIGT